MPTQVFLPSSSPLLSQIVDRLLPSTGTGPLRMENYWILSPTRQSGRRLREALTLEWRQRGGTALLGLEVHPPSVLFQKEQPDHVAHAFDWMTAWQEVLVHQDPESLPALMPQQTEPMTPSVALSFGQRLQRLRDELFDAGLDLTSVASSPLLTSEQERWEDLADLESRYRDRLQSMGLVDPVDAKRQALKDFSLPSETETLLLAGVPDPSPVLLERLREIDQHAACEVWIHAEKSEASLFTEWGVPTGAWRDRTVGNTRQPEGWIECLADPDSVLSRMRELSQEAPDHPDLALGLLDSSLSKPLANALEAESRSLYDPSPISLGESPLVRLLKSLHLHRQKDDPESLRALWRQPLLLQTLSPEDPVGLLRAWETYAAESFPDCSRALDQTLKPGPLREAWDTLKTWTRRSSAREWLELLRQLTEQENVDTTFPEDRFRLRQVQQVAQVLQEAIRREEEGRGPDAGVILEALSREAVDPLRVEGTFTAEGWLELPYHPGTQLLLIGLQEGNVPPPPPRDPILPQQLREDLGLRSDRDWLARDTYLFHTMLTSRSPGDVRVWVLKRTRDGSPLMPSRLLFACEDEEFLHRTAQLFRDPVPPAAVPPPAGGIQLDPNRVPHRDINRLSVSDINSYLQCPTRFYLKNVLGMETRDDRVTEPDAAAFGTLVHQVLETVVKAGRCQEGEWRERCEAVVHSLISKQLGAPESMSLRVFQRAALKRVIAAGRVQQRMWEEGWEPVEYEKKFLRTCGGVEISGKVDRLDRHPDKGIRIIDYKTSDSPDRPEAVHLGPPREGRELIQVEVGTKTRQWTNLQLPLYRWLVSPTVAGEEIEVAYLNLPSAVSDTQLVSWDKEPQLAGAAERCLEHVVHLIQKGVWHPTTTTSSPWDVFAPLLRDGTEWIPG